ncbi:hypothetical protein PR048_016526 [Dryococelus australis]|uniref:Uncharacterized protein n=1 Tax=Dryococelus australis TaxID=614101 RepID=A0ABQ9HJZ1_9NEOP|nr:hypothetical protein PR048_016526 [Dryococelus australis]
MQGWGKWEISEKTHRPAASSHITKIRGIVWPRYGADVYTVARPGPRHYDTCLNLRFRDVTARFRYSSCSATVFFSSLPPGGSTEVRLPTPPTGGGSCYHTESGVSAQLRRVVPGGDVQSLASSAEVSSLQAVHGIIKQHECSGEKSPSTNKSRMSSLSPMRSHGERSRQPMREQGEEVEIHFYVLAQSYILSRWPLEGDEMLVLRQLDHRGRVRVGGTPWFESPSRIITYEVHMLTLRLPEREPELLYLRVLLHKTKAELAGTCSESDIDSTATETSSSSQPSEDETGFYSIMADETKDVSKVEQLAILIRNVDCDDWKIKERDIGLHHLKNYSAQGLDLKNCVEQCYDGANVMSGWENGVQAREKHQAPHAIYFHCHANHFN